MYFPKANRTRKLDELFDIRKLCPYLLPSSHAKMESLQRDHEIVKVNIKGTPQMVQIILAKSRTFYVGQNI